MTGDSSDGLLNYLDSDYADNGITPIAKQQVRTGILFACIAPLWVC